MSLIRKEPHSKSLDHKYGYDANPALPQRVENEEEIRCIGLKVGFNNPAFPRVTKLSSEEVSRVAEILDFSLDF